ncbi:HlyD family secretion protein [Aestuariirhabdus sp. Z084]|uniref:HlyD family secretion protein n=1 Tax=Aestuariirhabdus haliotis TaxID=2918751 RepID=UPI00201B3D3E|nr:HlyD family secretion protein [Aestuariirhabdus haliotis]MCL6416143.1 HlyD family secretion protein [Aestuariirhabdus haliotis]MCL6420100.1 HlyD family secretion protein [Aestuariirhabdus haliotis]
MKGISRYLLTGFIVLIASGALSYKYWEYITNPWTRDGQVRAQVIQVTSRVSGPITLLVAEDNQRVNQGDLLFEIDPRTFAADLERAQAQYDKTIDNHLAMKKQVEVAEAQVEASRTQIQQAQSSINQLSATIEKNQAEYDRQQDLLPQKATSQKSVERAKANLEVSIQQRQGAVAGLAQARANLLQSEASLAEAQAQLGAEGEANASIREAAAAVTQAQLNYEFTRVKAPVDGYVTNLNLRLGSQAVANQPALALVDINSYWIDGFFKETYVGEFDKGDKAVVTLMSYPDIPLQGRVDSIGWGISQQDGSTGFDLLPTISPTFEWIRLAQRIPVRIHLDEVPEGVELRVGSTASVLVKSRTKATRVKQ